MSYDSEMEFVKTTETRDGKPIYQARWVETKEVVAVLKWSQHMRRWLLEVKSTHWLDQHYLRIVLAWMDEARP